MLQKIDTTAIRTNHPILSIISRDVELFEVHEDREYRGACPFCQTGNDRFAVWPHGAGVGKFNCKVCGRKGDVLDYVQQRHNLGFIGAVRFLEGQPAQTSPQKPLQRLSEPKLSGNDLIEWQYKLELMSQQSMECLLYSDKAIPARQWLAGRGIDWYTAAHFGLGFNDHWREIIPGYKLPPGILIPRWNDDIEISGVNIYLSREAREIFDSKRAWVKGSKPKDALFNGWRLDTADTVLIFEGELDASLSQRFLSPQANQDTIAVATGGVDSIPHDLTNLQDKRVIVIPDNDVAGKTFAANWQELLPGCQVLNVPGDYKDLTDYWKGGGDVAQLLNEVLK